MDHSRTTISLAESLTLKSVPELRTLAKGYAIKGTTRMRKADLVQAVHSALTKPQRLEELLYVMAGPSWALFRQAAGTEETVTTVPKDSDACRMLAELGYLHICGETDSLVCMVPSEIKEVFHSLERKGFLQRKANYDLLHRYAEAAVSLYGVISQTDFIDLFNSQNSPPTTQGEVFRALIRHIAVDTGYCFWEDYLVDTGFEENDFADVPDLLDRIGEKPRYIPTREEFLRYSTWNYFEHTTESQRLEQYLIHTLGVAPLVSPQIISELHSACVVEGSVQELFAILTDHGVRFDERQLGELSQLISAFSNATRLWSNNGHTPSEIFQLYQRDQLRPRLDQKQKTKIGRNDPCPCGSGKKYKKCCGR